MVADVCPSPKFHNQAVPGASTEVLVNTTGLLISACCGLTVKDASGAKVQTVGEMSNEVVMGLPSGAKRLFTAY